MLDKKFLSNRFMAFVENECKGSSILYEYLSLQISKDDDLAGKEYKQTVAETDGHGRCFKWFIQDRILVK